MRENIYEHLGRELTRKQFLQLMVAAVIAIFGFNNLVSLLLGKKTVIPQQMQQNSSHGFGASKFGI